MKENQIRELVNELRDIAIEYHGTQQLRERIARTVRAALLQGSQPVSNHDELPYAQVKAVADLYALCWQSGEVVTYTPDPEKATIWLNNYSGTCVQEYVKLERLQEALAGNSPVIPDDWVMVPKEPTRQMMAQGHFAMKGTDRGKFRRIYQAMITAASALNKGEY
ncbi:eaa protein [Salmonella enterica subsp. enterica]|nr:eaa protein [Salmonella enterica subsp. enterica]EDZ8639052.1 eaa protein [Salmonella enterica subsp. enterica serovar Schwarzengrund]EEJ8540580.1 eaa protein [Salmonella enterica subsp. enterica]